MLRALIFISLFIYSLISQAQKPSSRYQIDMIVFMHLNALSDSTKNAVSPLLAPNTKQAIPLEMSASNTNTPYQILSASASQLRDDYWTLNHKPQYQVLLHYTWLQPNNNQRAIALSQRSNGWTVEGTLRIRRSNYYLLDTELLFSAPNSKQGAFIFAQKQRLKPGVTYYLDHPQAGMLIKIHQIS